MVSFTSTELVSYLPAGWMPAGPGAWIAAERLWRVMVRDHAELEWTLEVKARDIGDLGREAALRRAIDILYRERFF